MIVALIIFGLIAAIALLIPVSFEIIAFAHNYRIFQKRDDDFFDYALNVFYLFILVWNKN